MRAMSEAMQALRELGGKLVVALSFNNPEDLSAIMLSRITYLKESQPLTTITKTISSSSQDQRKCIEVDGGCS